MDINKKINYRSWVIEALLLCNWSKQSIEDVKKTMFTSNDLSIWARVHLSSDLKIGRTSYFKKHLINQVRINKLKKLGFNYLGNQIGFGENVIVK